MKYIVSCLFVFIMSLNSANAALIVENSGETPTSLYIELNWEPDTSSIYDFAGTFWTAYVKTTFVTPDEWIIDWSFQHIFAPHPGDLVGNIFFDSKSFLDSDYSGFGLGGSLSHPNIGHKDKWSFDYLRSLSTDNNTFTLSVNHVPEPSSIATFSIALMVFFLINRRKHKFSVNKI